MSFLLLLLLWLLLELRIRLVCLLWICPNSIQYFVAHKREYVCMDGWMECASFTDNILNNLLRGRRNILTYLHQQNRRADFYCSQRLKLY